MDNSYNVSEGARRRRNELHQTNQDGIDEVDAASPLLRPRAGGNRQTGRGRREHESNRPKASVAFIVIGLFYLLIGIFIHQRMNSYPQAKMVATAEPHEFIEENARVHLEKITGFGPRVSGSDANRRAEDYILHKIKQIKHESATFNTIDVDVQVASGGLTLDFVNVGLGEFTSVYQDLRNIIVKLSPPQGANYSLLVNCHYDTVIDSPGAGDDAASCCVMLEILRALSQKDISLQHNVIFLFNSAEENILQTSHAFITQHPWASSIRAFINLDSAGAGGWEIVFQTGPEHPWLIKAYIESAPYPHASVLGQEVFQTGLIPSDTDFRIFRDYGHIPGIDIAHIKNGYVYHTKNDQARFIPPGCMQRGGENVLALVIKLASSSQLVNPGEDRHGTMVFFDFLGFFMLAYPQRMALILNWTTFVYVYVTFIKRFLQNRGQNRGTVLSSMLVALAAMLSTWIFIVLAPLGMALILCLLGRSLSYYTHTLNIIWLFILPSIAAAISFHLVLKRTVFKNTPTTSVIVMLQEANMMLWSLVLGGMTYLGLMSSFLPLMFILWPAFFYTVRDILGFKPTGVVFSIVASFGPSMMSSFLAYLLLVFLIPIMGRVGLEASPDISIAALCAFPVLVCLPYHIGFVYSHIRVGRVISTISAVILLGLCAVLFTSAGFPYSSSPAEASHQRAMLVHMDRKFHSAEGKVTKEDSSIWYKPLDHHGGKMLEQLAPDALAPARTASCDGVYCGRPYLYPFLPLVDARKTYDFPASRLNVTRVGVKLVERVELPENKLRLTFNMTGPSHVTIFIMEYPQVDVVQWTFGHKKPIEILTLSSIRHPTFFIYYSHAGPLGTVWNFSVDVKVEEGRSLSSPVVRMAFSGHHLHGPKQLTSELRALEKTLPPWMISVRWSATYDEYSF